MLCLRAADAIVLSARGLISQPTEKYTSRFSYLILSRLHLRWARRVAKGIGRGVCERSTNKKRFNSTLHHTMCSPQQKSSICSLGKKTHIIINPTRNTKPRHSAHPPTDIRLRKRFFRANKKLNFLFVCFFFEPRTLNQQKLRFVFSYSGLIREIHISFKVAVNLICDFLAMVENNKGTMVSGV